MFNFFNDFNAESGDFSKFELYLKNGNLLCLSNVKKLLKVDEEELTLSVNGALIYIRGSKLKVERLESRYLEIGGKITNIEVKCDA